MLVYVSHGSLVLVAQAFFCCPFWRVPKGQKIPPDPQSRRNTGSRLNKDGSSMAIAKCFIQLLHRPVPRHKTVVGSVPALNECRMLNSSLYVELHG